MARPRSETLTPREAEIMSVLWQRKAATADDVRKAIPGDLHDSTVRTILRVLESKGYASHAVDGKTYVYSPAVPQEKAEGRAVSSFLRRFFGGSARALVLRLIEDEHLTAEELEDLRRRSRPGGHKRGRKGGPA
ncbi:MAG: BlaI/MecI/CopY family transcriptional regulator [Planctomycetes bacterium]|nr:BlaI/MecI/CopY family transcriptional regulator [Planctomycetota bacterium]